MKWAQLTVPVRVETKQGRLLKHVRRAPQWRKAVRALLDDARVKRAKSHPALDMPRGIDPEHVWEVRVEGVPFRCCVQFLVCPPDGTPPGFRGRVDVLCRYDA